MTQDKSRREFLQSASLAGAAFVAGAAAISVEGCGAPAQVRLDLEPGDRSGALNGTLYITDPKLAQRIYDQLEKNGELTGIYYGEDREKRTKQMDTVGSPNSKKRNVAMTSADSTAAPAPTNLAGASTELDVIAGVTVKFMVNNPTEAGGKIIVNSLCGCR